MLSDLLVADAWVAESDPFGLAAKRLCDARISAIAVLDEDRQVIGLLTEDDVVGGFFPPYLRELKHTAFLEGEFESLQNSAREASAEPASKHMREPIVLELSTGGAHVAEVFLHCEWGAVAVVEDGAFVGMVRQVDFCAALLDRLAR